MLMNDFDWFNDYTKCFPCNGNNITILDTPECFYKVLKEKIEEANHRIVWSSLYIGTGKQEKELIETLLKRCQWHKVNKNHAFNVLILLDYLRGSRSVKNVDGISALGISDQFKSSNQNVAGFNPCNLRPTAPRINRGPNDKSGAKQQSRRSAADIILPSDYTSSREMVLPLLKHYSEHVSVYLYRSPKFSTLKRFLLSGSFREITGLNHVKAYIFDNDIIISGANLSQTYFTDRQDRYMLIRNNKPLCDHLHAFVKLLCRASYCLLPDDTTTLLPCLHAKRLNSNTGSFMSRAALGQAIRDHFDGLLHKLRIEKARAMAKVSRYAKDEIWGYVYVRDKRWRALPFLPTKRINYEALELNGLLLESRKMSREISLTEVPSFNANTTGDTISNDQVDTYIYPLVQAGPHGVYSDSEATAQLLTKIGPGSRLWLATGYFNMVPSYADILLNKLPSSPIAPDSYAPYSGSLRKRGLKSLSMQNRPLYSTNLILASPQANGFFGASGFKKYIPLIYSYAAKLFYDKIHVPMTSDFDGEHGILYRLFRKLLERCHLCEPIKNEQKWDRNYAILPEDTNPNQITLWEYARNAWTYHAKGLWLYPPLDRYPNLTFVGSSNFGYRSVFRDVELQLAIVTSNSNLRGNFKMSLIVYSNIPAKLLMPLL